MTIQLAPIYLRDYKVPDYLLEKVELRFELEDEFTTVRSQLTVYANTSSPARAADLILSGEELELVWIAMDGVELNSSQYEKNSHSLTIFNGPERFNLTIVTRIRPQKNTELSGLYQSIGNFLYSM